MSNRYSSHHPRAAPTTRRERAGPRPARPESDEPCSYSRSRTPPGRWPARPQILARTRLPPTTWADPPACGSASPAPRLRRTAPTHRAGVVTGGQEPGRHRPWWPPQPKCAWKAGAPVRLAGQSDQPTGAVAREALPFGHDYFGTEHILLGLDP